MAQLTLKQAMRLKGDKYSKQIHNFSVKHPYVNNLFWLPYNNFNGYCPDRKGMLYFSTGYKKGSHFSGCALGTVLSSSYTMGTFIGGDEFLKALEHIEDRTDWFIKNYSQFGTCSLDSGFYRHKFVTINKNSRRCKNCGKIQTRTIQNITTHKRKEIWS